MNYIDAVQDTVEYMQANYREDITLDELAGKAFFSKYHYLRLFHLLAGESPIEYLRKYRLNRAAYYLSASAKTNTEIALECGFNSPVVFSRLFKKAFGITPTSYRSKRMTLPAFCELNLRYCGNAAKKSAAMFGPRFVDRDESRIMGIECRITIENNSKNRIIEKLWKKFCPKSYLLPGRINDGISYGISRCDPSAGRHVYIAGVEVSGSEEAPAGMVSRVLPKSRYAVFTIKGSRKEIQENFQNYLKFIFIEWLPDSGYELGSDFDLMEFYDDRFKDECSQMDIYVPIEQKR